MVCLRLTTAYLSTKLEGGDKIKMLIWNGKAFEPTWPDPVRPNPEATKAMLQEECSTRAKRMKNLHINLSTAYGLVLGQCTGYLRSLLEGQEKLETTSNDWYLLRLLKNVKSLMHKYDKDTKYHHISYHTLLCSTILFC